MSMGDAEVSSTSEPIAARLRRVLRDALQLAELPVKDDFRRQDVRAWDSVSHLRLMLEIEAEFGISLDDEAFAATESLSEIERLLRRNGVAG